MARAVAKRAVILAEVLVAITVLGAFMAATAGLKRAERSRQIETIRRLKGLMEARTTLSELLCVRKSPTVPVGLPSADVRKEAAGLLTIRSFDYVGTEGLKVVTIKVPPGPEAGEHYEVIVADESRETLR